MAVDTYALTTLAKLKAWLGITISTYDTLLEASIDRASAKIESYCGREFLIRAQTEWKDTWGAERFVLKHSPVTNVRFIGTGTNSVLTVSSTTASDVAASVTVHDAHLHHRAVLVRPRRDLAVEVLLPQGGQHADEA